MDSFSAREQRSLQALAAYESWAKTPDRRERTAPAHRALMERFETQVDPQRVLPAKQRAAMADAAMRAHFSRMSLRAKVNRSKAKAAREQAVRLERDADAADAELRAAAGESGHDAA